MLILGVLNALKKNKNRGWREGLELRAAILGRLVRENFYKMMLEQKSKGSEEVSCGIFGRRVFKTEGEVYANAWR